MKRFILPLAALALALTAAAFLDTARANAADDPVSGWLAPSCGDKVSDDLFEGEHDCRQDTNSARICVDDGRVNLLYDHADDLEDLLEAINEIDGHSAALGGCGRGADPGDPPSAPNSYVCYSKWEQDGGMVALVANIPGMLAGGGWQPYAVAGAVPGGDNLGTSYHLVCNLSDGQKPTGMLVDLNGYDGYSPTLLGMIGLFQVAA